MERYAETANFSLTPTNCNALLCNCLNLMPSYDFDLMAIVHSDVAPPPFWLDTLYREMQVHQADFVSACIAIKTEQGLVSTAIAQSLDDYDVFTRLTVAQVRHSTFPTTFDINMAMNALERLPEPLTIYDVPRRALLCNTGLCLFNIKKLDPSKIYFNDPSLIRWHADGGWRPYTEPEDWFFSRKWQEAGLKVVATTALDVQHKGIAAWGTTDVTGEPRDPLKFPANANERRTNQAADHGDHHGASDGLGKAELLDQRPVGELGRIPEGSERRAERAAGVTADG